MWLKLVTARVDRLSCSLCETSRTTDAQRLRVAIEAWCVRSVICCAVSAAISRLPIELDHAQPEPVPLAWPYEMPRPIESPAAATPLKPP